MKLFRNTLREVLEWYHSLPQEEKDKLTEECKRVNKSAHFNTLTDIAVLDKKASPWYPPRNK